MANTSISFHMLLCLIFLSSHACNARPFGVQLSSKNREHGDRLRDTSVLLPAAAQPSISKNLVVADHESRINGEDEEDFMKIDSNLDQVESSRDHHSVEFRLPHKKRGDKQPGFNLDYAPPKTHPPVHN